MNQLYFGDNLEIMKDLHRKHPEGFIDLIYIDPPFNSKRNYNVLFESLDMTDTKAQKEAFADTWSNVSYLDTLNELRTLNPDLFSFLETLDRIRISKSAVSYLNTMAIRIWYMHRLLKDTGSFYLHCDPTMSHYLKMVCDLIFGEKNFRNEITWQRTRSAKQQSKSFGKITDIIFFFSKNEQYVFNKLFTPLRKEYIESHYRNIEKETGKKFMLDNFSQAGQGEARKFGDKVLSPPNGKHWIWSQEKIDLGMMTGKIVFSENGNPRVKRYLDEIKGEFMSNIWTDIPEINSQADERLGYPTQKPLALMERIIQASSNEGDLVADFFCGCGTTIAAAQKLNRRWIGADISHLAVKLISKRLTDTYGPEIRNTFEIFGFPKDIASARELAANPDKGRFKFEEWVVEVMLDGVINENRTQTGFDGYLTFNFQGKKELVMIEVKSGGATLTQLNHFIQTVNSKKGDLGVFVCFPEEVSKGMYESAKKQGYYREELFRMTYDKIQILTVDRILNGEKINIPRSTEMTFKTARREEKQSDQPKLFE
jgi:adenine specific DNA methylase Mod